MKITQFGDGILRERTRLLSEKEIQSPDIRKTIQLMRKMLIDKKLGIGLAAPQVGQSISLAVVEL